MSKPCQHPGCNNKPFSHRLCGYHQSDRTDQKYLDSVEKRKEKVKGYIKRGIERQMAHRTTPSLKSDPTLQKTLTDLCDNLFSKIVRKRAENEYGIVKCFTCDKTDYWSEMECGHFIPRKWLPVRWEFDNARPQCHECNCHKGGNLKVYEQNLVLEIGVEGVEALKIKSKAIFREDLTVLLSNLKKLTIK